MNWIELIEFFKTEEFSSLLTFLKQERAKGKSILPKPSQYLNALALTPFNDVKIVILGQDPYPGKTHAMGLSFSVPDSVKSLPGSLRNIFTELYNDLKVPISKSGNLTRWAEQGVLLLNTVLTVEEGRPGSHQGIGWEILTTEIICAINRYHENVVFILWGRHAIGKKVLIDCLNGKHLVITSPHPSPLSASSGFFGSRPFSQTNTFLVSKEIDPIKW